MDWNAAIDRQREALMRILAMLVAMAGCLGQPPFLPHEGASSADAARTERLSLAPTLPRHLHRAVLRLLRPAEAAARRLAIALARTLPAPQARDAAPPRPADPKRPSILDGGVGTGILMPPALAPAARAAVRKPSLPLFDPLRGPRPRRGHAPAAVPRISVPGLARPFPVALRGPLSPDDPVDAARLGLRLQALASALGDLAAQARRFARWQARRACASGAPGGRRPPRRVWPLRPGRPPGWRRKPDHAVHEVLDEAHWLALQAMERPDTS